jgi:hypothetical protein
MLLERREVGSSWEAGENGGMLSGTPTGGPATVALEMCLGDGLETTRVHGVADRDPPYYPVRPGH